MSIISVNSLTKSFKTPVRGEGFVNTLKSLVKPEIKMVNAVKSINFEIKEGEMVAFLGQNGAGKTTTLKMLSGILTPTSGTVSVLGFDPAQHKSEFKKQISLVMGQKNQLWWDLPAADTFLLNKDIYGISDKKYRQVLDELTELLEVKPILQTPVRRLSLGERMKCEIIASLLHQPKVLFLDEPTIGLDISIQRKIRSFLKTLNQRSNTTIILTSHYMADVTEICKRVILIDHGQKIYDDDIISLVSEYAKSKILKVEFSKEIPKSDLTKFGTLIEYTGYEIKLEVDRSLHTKIAAAILDKFPVTNIDILDVELEEIILKTFK